MPRFDLDRYVTVDARIDEFWSRYPEGRILTQFLSDPNDLKKVLVQAEVWTNRQDDGPAATGLAFEVEGGSGANQTSHVENAETSAIGRALANMGLKTMVDEPRPSRTEMEKVNRSQPYGQPESNTGGQGSVGLSRIFPGSGS